MIENLILGLISFTGGIYDVRLRKIPNWLTLGTFILVFLFNVFFVRSFHEIIHCLLGFFVGILLLLIPYIFGGMGAGDVKLLAAIGSIVGYKDIVLVFFYSTICGLFLGIIWLILNPKHIKFLITTGQILPTVDKKQKVPYGVAIAAGTLLYIVLRSNDFFGIVLWK